MSKPVAIIFNIARSVAALIMLQTLFFKFGASAESVELFTKIGWEPTGRIIVGILELIASILLFVPRFVWLGALLGIGLMIGAVFFHVTLLGIDELFALALVTLLSSIYVLYLKWYDVPYTSRQKS